uniref:Ig-like domain-containing protein n=1 Tax=Xenopus tropicalis TaxID=8364 RepID=A0A7D9NKI4_XENTR
ESVTLTCNVAPSAQGDPPYSWYKDGAPIGTKQQKYTVVSAQVSDSGEYQCKSNSSDRSEAVTLTVSNGSLSQINEGDPIMFKCDTNLSPRRETTELQFAFYRNGHNVQGFNSSNQYGVPSAQLEDSGNYTCEVQTPTGSVRKRSNMAHIHIQGEHKQFLKLQFPNPLQHTTCGYTVVSDATACQGVTGQSKEKWIIYSDGRNVSPGMDSQ